MLNIQKSSKEMKKILKFYSPTCGPCKAMSRILSTFNDVDIQDIDITDEDNESLIDEWKIKSVPTTIILGENGEFIKEFRGVVSVHRITEVLND